MVYWKAPSKAYGVITGYEVSFFLSGKENGSVVMRKESDEIFHIVKDGDLESVQGNTQVKVTKNSSSSYMIVTITGACKDSINQWSLV